MTIRQNEKRWRCPIDQSGRIVLPKPVLAMKNLENGDSVLLTVVQGEILLRTYDELLYSLQQEFKSGVPGGVSLVEELLEERREDAKIEDGR